MALSPPRRQGEWWTVRAGPEDLSRLLELHPVLACLAMLGGLAATIALAWLLPAGAGGAVFALGLVVFMLSWPYLLALHLEDTFGDFTEVKRWLVTACYVAALVLLPLALMIIELFSGWGWSLLFLIAWGGGCAAAGYLLWAANQALVFIEERRWVAPEQLVPSAPAAHGPAGGPRGRVERGLRRDQPARRAV
jgi:hypothetical protein